LDKDGDDITLTLLRHSNKSSTLNDLPNVETMTDDNLINEVRAGRCPRCDAAQLHAWSELDEAGREVVRRLPASAVYSQEERAERHLWCVRCWHEETGGARREV
jgi:hypothetical protein